MPSALSPRAAGGTSRWPGWFRGCPRVAVPGVPHGDSTGCAFPRPLSPALTGFSCSRRLMLGVQGAGAGCERWPWEGGGGGGRREQGACGLWVMEGGP